MAWVAETPWGVLTKQIEIMKHELREMMRAYDTYLDKVSRFIEVTDESERYKLIAFDIIESQSIELERQLNDAEEVLTQYIEDQG